MGNEQILPPGDDDVLLVKKAIPLQLENSELTTSIPVRAVFKRFLSHDRLVFCWEGTAEWPCELAESASDRTDANAPAPTGVPMREKGWGLVRPVLCSDTGAPSGLCNLQVCVHMTPGLSDDRVLEAPAQVAALANMVIPTYQRVMAAHFQMIENFLVDTSL